jgi:DNA-binding CsgD family transcriptional regulator
MSLYLTAADLTRCEAASRALLSPLAANTIDEWRADVLRTLREMLHSDHAIFMLSTAEQVHFSDSLDEHIVQGYDRYLKGTDEAGVLLSDPVIERWLQVRQAAGLDVFGNAESDALLRPFGLSLRHSPMYQDGIASAGVVDQRSMFSGFTGGAALIQCGLTRVGSKPFEEHALTLLRVLMPSFRAGLEALNRFAGRAASLDAVPQPVVVFGHGRRELHRNSAFSRMLEAEPERDRLDSAIAQVARRLFPLAAGRAGERLEEVLPENARILTTSSARYRLQPSILGPGTFADYPVLMVFVERRGTSRLPPPESLRDRFGLTPREAEVAILLAEGHTNAIIAERLFLSPHTIRRHIESVFAKVGVNSRKALGLRFLES